MRTRSQSRLKPQLLSPPIVHLQHGVDEALKVACGVSLELVRGMTNVREFCTCTECRRVSDEA